MSRQTARDVMTTPAVACGEDAFFEEVAEILVQRGISGVPIVDEDRRSLGVVTRGDVLWVVAHLPRQTIDLTAPPILVESAGIHPARGMWE